MTRTNYEQLKRPPLAMTQRESLLQQNLDIMQGKRSHAACTEREKMEGEGDRIGGGEGGTKANG